MKSNTMDSFHAEEWKRWSKASRSPVGASARPNRYPPGQRPQPPKMLFPCHFCRDSEEEEKCTPAQRVRPHRCDRCIDLGLECGPPLPPAPPPQLVSSGSSQGIHRHSLYLESPMSVHDDQRRGPSERGEGFTIQVQEKLPDLSLFTGKNSSTPGFRDSTDFNKTFSLTAVKSWNSSDPFAQISRTISKDNTEGECARQAKLLAEFGRKIKLCPVQHNFTSSQSSVEATSDIDDEVLAHAGGASSDSEDEEDDATIDISRESSPDKMASGRPTTKKSSATAPVSGRLGADLFRAATSSSKTIEILLREFKKNPAPTPQTYEQLANDTGLEVKSIIHWFISQRSREREEQRREAYEAKQALDALSL